MENLKFSNVSFDLDEIFKYCRVNNNDEQTGKRSTEYRQQEITNNYDLNDGNSLVLTNKSVHEVVTPKDGPIYDEVKLEFIRELMNVILDKKDATDNVLTAFSFVELLALQTFTDYKFLKINSDTNNIENEQE